MRYFSFLVWVLDVGGPFLVRWPPLSSPSRPFVNQWERNTQNWSTDTPPALVFFFGRGGSLSQLGCPPLLAHRHHPLSSVRQSRFQGGLCRRVIIHPSIQEGHHQPSPPSDLSPHFKKIPTFKKQRSVHYGHWFKLVLEFIWTHLLHVGCRVVFCRSSVWRRMRAFRAATAPSTRLPLPWPSRTTGLPGVGRDGQFSRISFEWGFGVV